MSYFRDYAEHGWLLCPIKEGFKRPTGIGWNKRENAITDPARAQHLFNAGLLHGFSGTCAIDIDNMDMSHAWLAARDVDLSALLRAPDAVQIVSGDASRGKLIYALPEPLPTKQIKNDDKSIILFELRCSSATGNSAQDVLPPSTNPRTGKRYEWRGDWRKLPPIPDTLHALWLELCGPVSSDRSAHLAPPSAANEELRRLISNKDPDTSYGEWLNLGMILHHETEGSEDGLALWDEWSSKGAKYNGFEELQYKWDSFGTSPVAVTAGSLRQEHKADDSAFGEPLSAARLDELTAPAEAIRAAKVQERVDSFQWTTLVELMRRPPSKWMIKKVLPREELAMLYGKSGAGKSFVALDMALAIARGVPWRDHDVEQGTVCWLAAEAEGSMRNRGRAYAKANDLQIDDIENFYVLGSGIDLADGELIRALAISARQLQPSLVVVDTLAAASGGANENSGEDMGRVLDNCRTIHRATGATVLLVHHSGKNEELGARGWSGIRAAVHAELSVAKREGDSALRDIIITKMRDGTEGEDMAFKLCEVTVDLDADDMPITSAYVEHTEDEPPKPVSRTKPTVTLRGRTHALLDALWPLDGEPVVSMDAFIQAYVDSMPAPTPGAPDRKRLQHAENELMGLARRNLVLVDNDARTITLIQPTAPAEFTPPTEDEDLL